MEFAYPAAFAGLLAIPLLVLLNLTRYRRLRIRVGSLIIWKKLASHVESPPSSRQRYFNLTLLAQIVFVLALTTAIAGPRTVHSAAGGRLLHLLVDCSASTQAAGAGGSVFKEMKRRASSLLSQLDESDRICCHAAGGLAGLVSTEPLSPTEAKTWLSGLAPAQTVADPRQAALEVSARAAAHGSQVFLFTDHAAADLPQSVIVCATPAYTDNAAIVAAGAASDSQGLKVFFRISNFSPAEKAIRWSVLGRPVAGNKARGRSFAASPDPGALIASGESLPVNLLLPPEASAENVLEVRLLDADSLMEDNSAYLFRNPAGKLQISYIGEQDPDLLRILSALPGATVSLVRQPLPGCSLAVFNQASPLELPESESVFIAPPRGIPGLVAAEETFKPQGPLTAGESWAMPNPGWADKLDVREAIRPALLRRRGTTVVLADGDTPLIILFSLEGRKLLYIGFKLSNTNWTSQVSFPLFWGILMEVLGSENRESKRAISQWATCTTGATLALPARGLRSVVSPSGSETTPRYSGQRVLFRPESIGLYRVNYKDGQKLFGASLLSSSESRLSNADIPLDSSALTLPGSLESIAGPQWLWQYFAFIAAVAMLTSWLLWRERK